MILLQIDGKIEQIWRCQALSSSIQTFRRVRSIDWGTPDRLVTSFSSGPHYYLEVVLTGRILICWTDSPVEVSKVAGINTIAKTIELTSGESVSSRITDRHPTDKEQEFIQQERLIESNNAIAATLSALQKKSKKRKLVRPIIKSIKPINNVHNQNICPVCSWVHDARFTQIQISRNDVITLAGVLPEIIALIHNAHEKGFPALSTKDDKLLKICGGYGSPCKAFDDLNHRDDYKKLFDTRRRGFISLRGSVGINRNKSEAGPE